ncbi:MULTISPECIES: UDP-glucuronic acid decarboxylase family protein [Actibacterium]|uniref:UDP-glucuronate decarboxylase n=1 Tax=Actibacterium naphthalenivorans TaxID=1614693 RepID=A0A840C5I8_9RHOB|nr:MULTISPECIES: UDP-glucuronic acid decarboxylase family protein [Actibacterium]ALG89214.1 NAD-dependent dehydratase [Actibacterium sp. EMB200-NS6]MBB4021201.1 UDP-glucuronate decarboxylase [Actibacterium naphthalenivorans]
MTLVRIPLTALVAGGAGFVGSHLCDALLARGIRVVCVDNFHTGRRSNVAPLENDHNFRLVEADVATDPLPEEPVDWIFNLASPASPPHYQADPVRTMMTNVVGTRNLLALAAQSGARYLQASTSEVYGDPELHPQREDYWGHVNPIGIRACYDEGKRAAESLCYDHRRDLGVDVRVARIFNTYGPRMRSDDGRIVSNFLVQALEGRDLTVYGDGSQTRSFCYVSDLVRGLIALAAVEATPAGPVNLGNPAEISVLDLARLILRAIPSSSEIVFHPLPSDDPRRRQPDIGLARDLLGWEPRVPFHEGLASTAAWFAIPEHRSVAGDDVARAAE